MKNVILVGLVSLCAFACDPVGDEEDKELVDEILDSENDEGFSDAEWATVCAARNECEYGCAEDNESARYVWESANDAEDELDCAEAWEASGDCQAWEACRYE